MHPPLTKDKHPLCGDVIDAFEACHKANVYNRFFGFCNEQKYALDKCFRAEVSVVDYVLARLDSRRCKGAPSCEIHGNAFSQKLVKARASLAKSKEDQQRLREIIVRRS